MKLRIQDIQLSSSILYLHLHFPMPRIPVSGKSGMIKFYYEKKSHIYFIQSFTHNSFYNTNITSNINISDGSDFISLQFFLLIE